MQQSSLGEASTSNKKFRKEPLTRIYRQCSIFQSFQTIIHQKIPLFTKIPKEVPVSTNGTKHTYIYTVYRTLFLENFFPMIISMTLHKIDNLQFHC